MVRIYRIVLLTTIFALSLNTLTAKEAATITRCDISGQAILSDGTSLVGAIAMIRSIEKYAITDEDGKFNLSKIPYGSYTLEISTLEAEPKLFAIECREPELDLALELTPRAIISDEVIVQGKSEAVVFKEKGYAMNVVDMSKANLTSLLSSELLDRTAGIKLRQSGGVGSEINYNINGLSGNSIRVFIDGIPIRNYGSSFSLSSIPTSMIERIEVYKGVVPAHLSEDALGGAINIVLKESSLTNLSTSYSYGSFNTHKWDMNGNYRHEKSGFTVGASAFYNYTDNNYKVWGDQVYVTDPKTGIVEDIVATRFHDNYRSAGINAKLGFTRKKWADRLMLGLLYSDMKKDIQNGSTMAVVYGNRTSQQDTKMANLQYSKRDIVKGLDISAFGTYSSGVRQVVDTIAEMYDWTGNVVRYPNGDPYLWNKNGGESGKATLAANLEQNMAARANIGYSFLPNHKISANVLYDQFTRDVDDPLLPEVEQRFTETRYLTKQIMGLTYETSLVNDRLKLSGFYKHYMQNLALTDPRFVDGVMTPEYIDKTVNENGYGGAASFKLTPTVLLVFSAEKALRLPDSNEILGNTSENVLVTYDLDPEQSTNLNLGVILGDFKFGDHTLSADVNFFYRDVKDMIQKALVPTVTEDMYSYENLGRVLSKGFDLEINYDWMKKIYVELNVSNFNARFNLQYDEYGDQYVYYGDRLRNAPYFTLNNNIAYVTKNLFQRGSKFTANYNFGYVHAFDRNWESIGGAGKTIIPSQIVHDIGFVYTFPTEKISISFDAKNIFNEQVFDNWALQRPGRAFFGKISYNILK